MVHTYRSESMYIYEDDDKTLYKFIIEKMPDLFKRISRKVCSSPLIKKNDCIIFNDNIGNPINRDKEKFNIIVINI